ncbi:MAG: SDR family NAD(P)-dependent oxidoreductase [Candidatus Promineifilaceae bacterium]|nr:SDR family NAD(P)-dependent oxidoreductase [Candidatus Promineifilaceae bacterium]
MKGRRVVITGAGRGIGRDMALGFAREGATVVLTARTAPELEALADEINDAGGSALPVCCDVTDPEQVARLHGTVAARLGGADVLVNNAGVAGSHKFIDHPDDLWHRMLAVNLTGVYLVTKAFAPGMVAQEWGRIINIASTAAKTGGRYIAAYTASKHGVLGLTRALAVELAPHVTVNALCPAYVDTPMTEATIANIVAKTGMALEEARAALERDNLQNRLIQPEEITALALHLAQDSSRGITGQAINVDGGSVMW